MTESTVKVELAAASYDICIDTGNLPTIAAELEKLSPTRVFVIHDENVHPHWQVVQQALGSCSFPMDDFEVPAGESSKSLSMAEKIWEFLADRRADRKSLVLALGGGVVGDLAGFIAASFARGIPFYQVPTTLLAHVDSSVGGKTGINLSSAKNMVGAFWQPQGVLIDIATLNTLADREYVSGLAEVIKYGLIMDEAFFQQLEEQAPGLVKRDPALLIEVIAHCCRLKAVVVQEDGRETSGRRAILNYGHTFAHAIETTFGYGQYLHGEAVALGMLCAGDLARRLGRVDDSFCERQFQLIQSVGLPTAIRPVNPNSLIDVMRRDKKNVDDIIRFILPDRLGHVELISEPIAHELIVASIERYLGA